MLFLLLRILFSTAFSHLLRLSMEFFGGKRTGDLMSRISSDTDRICQFLSVNVVDFANDVLGSLIAKSDRFDFPNVNEMLAFMERAA